MVNDGNPYALQSREAMEIHRNGAAQTQTGVEGAKAEVNSDILDRWREMEGPYRIVSGRPGSGTQFLMNTETNSIQRAMISIEGANNQYYATELSGSQINEMRARDPEFERNLDSAFIKELASDMPDNTVGQQDAIKQRWMDVKDQHGNSLTRESSNGVLFQLNEQGDVHKVGLPQGDGTMRVFSGEYLQRLRRIKPNIDQRIDGIEEGYASVLAASVAAQAENDAAANGSSGGSDSSSDAEADADAAASVETPAVTGMAAELTEKGIKIDDGTRHADIRATLQGDERYGATTEAYSFDTQDGRIELLVDGNGHIRGASHIMDDGSYATMNVNEINAQFGRMGNIPVDEYGMQVAQLLNDGNPIPVVGEIDWASGHRNQDSTLRDTYRENPLAWGNNVSGVAASAGAAASQHQEQVHAQTVSSQGSNVQSSAAPVEEYVEVQASQLGVAFSSVAGGVVSDERGVYNYTSVEAIQNAQGLASGDFAAAAGADDGMLLLKKSDLTAAFGEAAVEQMVANAPQANASYGSYSFATEQGTSAMRQQFDSARIGQEPMAPQQDMDNSLSATQDASLQRTFGDAVNYNPANDIAPASNAPAVEEQQHVAHYGLA
ncbi:MAG: hypothetical protein CMH28_08625 [Micavibrio sp.]|nr:hypothetical protein [Micavibrio sp.]